MKNDLRAEKKEIRHLKVKLWFETHTILLLALFGCGCILFATLVHVFFKLESDSVFTAKWEAGDMLNFGAAFFTLIGTLFLGYMAYRQGQISNEISRRMDVSDQMRLRLERQPSILCIYAKNDPISDTTRAPKLVHLFYSSSQLGMEMIFSGKYKEEDLDDYYEEDEKNRESLYVEFVNSMDSMILVKEMSANISCLDDEITAIYNDILVFDGKERQYIELNYPKPSMEVTCKLTLTMQLCNRLGDTYKEVITFSDFIGSPSIDYNFELRFIPMIQ